MNQNPETQAPNPVNSRMIPPGNYRARPVRWGLIKNEDTGSITYAVELETTDRRMITWFGALRTEETNGHSAWEITERSLRAMGWEGDNIMEVTLTRAVNISVDHETYNGKTRAKVVSVDQSVIERNPVSRAEAEAIAETLRRASSRR